MRGRHLICLFFVLCLAVALVATGCGKKEAPSTGPATAEKTKEPVKIGGIFDLTGPTADVGQPYADGAKAYIDYLNSKGGVNGRQVELIDIDYAYDKTKALEAYNKLVKQDQVAAILGWGTGDTEALKQMIAADKIPYISGSYSEGLLDINLCPYNFLVAASYSDQARIALKWIKDNWKESRKPRVALIYNDTPFGKSPVADAKKYAAQIGIDIVADEVVDLKALDATSQMLDLKQKKADFAIIQGTSNLAATVLKDAKKNGLSTRFIGLNWAADEKVIKLAGPAAEGYIGVIPFAFPYEKVPGMAVIQEYLTAKGQKLEEKNQKFIQGWTSAMIMTEGIKRAGDKVTGEAIKAGLENLANFDTGGLSAPVTFTAQSHRGSEKVRLAEVKNGRFEYLTDWIGYK
ncbi:amino acid/amide ABC transporter substrate-binding protein (HAAT family) [Thermodesulfitimonas autotrophica]|uniref:Amino acid/amide ABC transporter substrate-binding protein (HAAT family) n=1 Tax=Thermodesulfitimonas autotrophica TaxID=1894989 RepID=A0A3N5APA3_9THEO|nr:ABC transporter substrate-binding protein [Thermodesulfitimonas autotrophica]RPF46939.1 amino acid/amide ABC transporter substrate-binding protein (HAAT family) [Thermodesulfitimonas autotrophica]